ncbi:lysyl-trna synthetase [Holotrichia oblita]|nr:lysyl-trna synthetase [Holotrichia oblita]
MKELEKLGVDPFGKRFDCTHSFSKIKELCAGLDHDQVGALNLHVKTAGRIITIRDMGKAAFITLQDRNNSIQVYIKKDNVSELDYQVYKLGDIGDFIGVEGDMMLTRTGELTIRVTSYTHLSKALKPLPEKFHGLVDVEERYRKRYLDLISNEESRAKFARASMVDLIKIHANVDFNQVTSLEEAKAAAKKHNIVVEKHFTRGHIIEAFFDQFVEKNLVQPTIVFGHPIEISPLSKKSTDPLYADRFELFIDGREYANAYSELNDPIDQKDRFLKQMEQKNLGNDEACEMDYDFVESLEYGMPPTGGIGIGGARMIKKRISRMAILLAFFSMIVGCNKNTTTENSTGSQDSQDPTTSSDSGHSSSEPDPVETITVTYLPKEGTFNPSFAGTKEYKENDKYQFPGIARSNYDLDGWYLYESNAYVGSALTTNDTVQFVNHSVAAKWIALHRVNLHLDGGSIAGDITYVEGREGSVISIPTPSKGDDTFGGWYTNEGLTNALLSTDTFSNLITDAYAKWIAPVVPTEVLVTFDADNGVVSPSTKEVTIGEAYGTLPVPTRDDFRFAGWKVAEAGQPVGDFITKDSDVIIATDHTLIAIWTQLFTVTLVKDAGATFATEHTGTFKIATGDEFPSLPVVEKEDHSFEGWYTDEDCLIPVGATFEGTTNINLYSKLDITVYIVTLDADGGTVTPTSLKAQISAGVYPKLPRPDYAAHHFDGWYYETTLVEEGDAFAINGNHTLVALWEDAAAQTVDLIFNNGDVDGSISIKEDELYSTYLPTDPEKADHYFAGWYTTVDFQDGTKINSESAFDTVVTALYARFLSAQDVADLFATEHSRVLTLTVDGVSINDKDDVEAALEAYGEFDSAITALLVTEKAKLDDLLEQIGLLEDAEEFKEDHAAALALDIDEITEDDREIIEAALEAFEELEDDVKDLLGDEETLLNNLLAQLDLLVEIDGFETSHARVLALTTSNVAITDKDDIDAALEDLGKLSASAQTALSSTETNLNDLLAKIDLLVAAKKFKDDHATALALEVESVAKENRDIVEAAQDDFALLTKDVQDLLTTEETLLNNLIKKISVLEEVDGFETSHARVLALTTSNVAITDKDDINVALEDLGKLSASAQTALSPTETNLNDLLTKIESLEKVATDAQSFKTLHSEALALEVATVTEDDREIIEAALEAFDELDEDVADLLTTEKGNLDNLLAELNKYVYITFTNPANNATETQKVEKGVEVTLQVSSFTYGEYQIVEWNTAKDGSGDSYAIDEKVTLSSNLTLYARWAMLGNGGSNTYDRKTVADKVTTSRDWVMSSGQTTFFGRNSAGSMLAGATANDLNAIKSVFPSATASTTGAAGVYSQFAMQNIGKITLTYSAVSGIAPKAYIASSTALTNAYSLVALNADGSLSAQGVQTAITTTFTFEFSTMLDSTYFALVFETSTYCRLTNLVISFYEGATKTEADKVADTKAKVDAELTKVANSTSTQLPVTDTNGSTISYSSDNSAVSIDSSGKVTIGSAATGSTSVTITATITNGATDDTTSITFDVKSYQEIADEFIIDDAIELESLLSGYDEKTISVDTITSLPVVLTNGSTVAWEVTNPLTNPNLVSIDNDGKVTVNLRTSDAEDGEVVITGIISCAYMGEDASDTMEVSIIVTVAVAPSSSSITFEEHTDLNLTDLAVNSSHELPILPDEFGRIFIGWRDKDSKVLYALEYELTVTRDYVLSAEFKINYVEDADTVSSMTFDSSLESSSKTDSYTTAQAKIAPWSYSLASNDRFSNDRYVKHLTLFKEINLSKLQVSLTGIPSSGGTVSYGFEVRLLNSSGAIINELTATKTLSYTAATSATHDFATITIPSSTTVYGLEIYCTSKSGTPNLDITNFKFAYEYSNLQVNANNTGIRFGTTFNITAYEDAGVLVIPSRLLDDHESVADYYLNHQAYDKDSNTSSMVIDIKANNVYKNIDSIKFSGLITNLPTEKYNDVLVATCYYVVDGQIYFSNEISSSLSSEAQSLIDAGGLDADDLIALTFIASKLVA